MPLPLGHAAIGFAVNDFCSNESVPNRLTLALFIVILANLPDIDFLFGLLLQGNGNAYHRGPTHSLLFALLFGFAASYAWRLWSQIPKINFTNGFFLIFSHVAADAFLTRSPVSFFWPFEVNWAAGFKGWEDVIRPVFLDAFNDVGIIIVCGGLMILNRLIAQICHHTPSPLEPDRSSRAHKVG